MFFFFMHVPVVVCAEIESQQASGTDQSSNASTTLKDPRSELGWVSDWIKPVGAHKAKSCFPQSDVVKEGDMSLEFGDAMAIERYFPEVSSGTLKIEMYVRPERVTTDIDDHEASVIKVYAASEEEQWAFRWHYPYAWPEVGGNTYPRFYVIDGGGSKRKGLEFTDFRIENREWYKVAAILNFENKTWEFYVNDVKLDYEKRFGREMSWWQFPSKLCRVRISNVYGMSWLDSLKIYHNGELISSCGFDSKEGYQSNVSIFDHTTVPS